MDTKLPQLALYRTVARNIPAMAILLIDQAWQCVLAEGAALSEQGFAASHTLPHPLTEILSSDMLSQIAPCIEAALAGRERSSYWSAGQQLYHIQALPCPNEQEEVAYCLLLSQDVTRYHSKLNGGWQLLHENRYLAGLLDKVSDAIISTDQDFRILSWNKAAEQIYGWRAEEVIGQDANAVIRPEHPTLALPAMLEILMTKGLWKGEVVQFHRSGAQRIISGQVTLLRDEQGQVTGSVAVNRDITEKRQAEQSAHASETLAKATIDSITAHIAILDEQGRIMMVNQAWRAFGANNGLSLDYPWEGMDYLAVCHQAAVTDPAVAQALEGLVQVKQQQITEYRFEYPCQTPAQLRWFSCRIRLLDHTLPGYLVIMHEDITTQKHMSDALRESEARLRTIIDSAVDVIYLKDLEGRYLMMNPAGARMFQRSQQEIMGKNDYELFPPEDAAHIIQIDAGVLAGEPIKYEAWRNYPGYQGYFQTIKVPFVVNRQIVGLLGITRDITQRKRAEEALHASEERFRIIAQMVSDALSDYHVETGLVWLSEGFTRLLHLKEPVSQAQIDWWFQRIHLDDLNRIQNLFQQTISQQRPHWQAEYRVLRDDGEYIAVEDHAAFMYSETGELRRFVGAITDVTVRKKMEQQTVMLLLEKERVRILEDFITALSHDFRTPLSVINTSSYLLGRATTPAAQTTYLQRMREQVEHMEKMVESLLTVIQLERGVDEFNLSAVRLAHVIDQLVTQTHRLWSRKDLSVKTLLPHDLPLIHADEVQMMRALYHIMKNAILYTPPGQEILVEATVEGEWGVVIIHDQGEGIAPDDLPHIFAPLYRGKSQHHRNDGQGLGLAIVQRIMEAHRGQVKVESVAGEGSTFRLFFPLFHAS